MEINRPKSSLPAYAAAEETFKTLDVQDASLRTGSKIEDESYSIDYLGQKVLLSHRGCNFIWEHPDRISSIDELIILHYFITASGAHPKGEYLALHELAPASSGWADNISRICMSPLCTAFGGDIGLLHSSAKQMNGESTSDNTVKIDILPHIPIYITVWTKDDEFDADARILFDKTLPQNLPREDMLVLPELAVYELLRCTRKPFSMPGTGEFR